MADTIKIAIVGPKTGPVTQYGDMQFIGAKQAIKDINAKGGVDGKMLEAKEYDDAADPKQAVAVANKIVNDGVKFVIGHMTSPTAQPASDIYEDEGIVMITPAATDPEITARGYKLTFRTLGLDSAQGLAASNYIAEHVKPKVVAVLHDKQQYGEGVATAVKQTLEGKGVKVVVFEGLTAGEKDFSTVIQKLKKNNVDFVYWGGFHPELGLILRQAQEKGLRARFMAAEACANDSVSRIAQGAAEGLLVTAPKTFEADLANQAIVDAIKNDGKDPSGPYVFPSYSAVQLIAEAIKKAGNPDTDKVAEEIHNGTFRTPTGDLSFDMNGDLKNFKFVVYQWHFGKPKTEVSPQ
ncbi:high-affinity branched-chain amino acid ABC transporter substrate-binding protein [Streptomyces sp. NRRL S-237]|uniref:high-affinity branched-chain amino acid ABC transporter substrate-binding protein n=1 Tax=Streptomyces sp. NRRL S-237 TaxID=1463895 RepID=UPI000A9E8E9F|nr:high-affinity branched-chain amino acid ABC transporter substrate-binding protein [Streptomyces sp. NRRL S-237]